MAESSCNDTAMPSQAPFLTYLTVFKSRLGIANLVAPITGLQHQPTPLVTRNLRKVLEERHPIEVAPRSDSVLEYLAEKKVVTGSKKRSSRYYGYSLRRRNDEWQVVSAGKEKDELPVYQTDLWMSDPRVRSTIGVPTPDNVDEVLELVHQLGLISRRTNSWTSAGTLLAGLREAWSPKYGDQSNPFVLRAEGICFLRQVLRTDGLIIRGILKAICQSDETQFTRDWVSQRFAQIVEAAVADAKRMTFQPPALREAQEHLAHIRKTAQRMEHPRGGRGSSPRGPGVLEHRVAPRLEWLTDLGVLSKEGFPRNSFQYARTEWAEVLLNSVSEEAALDADQAVLDQWHSNPLWSQPRTDLRSTTTNRGFVRAYRIMQRRIGPTSVSEVAFLGALFAPAPITFNEAERGLIELAHSTHGATLSGGRYQRGAQNLHMTEAALQGLS